MTCRVQALTFLEQERLLTFIGRTQEEGLIFLDRKKYQQRYGNTILLDKIEQLPKFQLVCIESKTTRIFRSMNPDEKTRSGCVELIRLRVMDPMCRE